MMNLRYSLRDAEQWAAFSGDDNPIHFDRDYAQKMGLEQLSVHGMRALLDMKSGLSSAPLPEAEFFLFTTRMRSPVWYQTDYHLQINGGGAGKLVDAANGECCFSSKLAVAKPLLLEANEQERTLLSAELLAAAQRFPVKSDPPWSFLDALLFQRLIAAPETLATVKTALPELSAERLIDVFTQLPIVQTHHEVHFDARLLSSVSIGELHYAILPTLVMGNKQSGFVLHTVIQARSLERPLISSAVTLKTWPLAN
jgi:hypothetical protein